MPTPMTIEMENEMNKDEIQAALSSFNSAMAYNPKIMAHCEKETIRAALQSQLTKNDENVTCGNLSNADGRQAALESIDRLDGWLSELKGMIEAPQELLLINRPSILADINCAIKDMRVNGACIRAALQSAQVKAETVDLEKLREEMAVKLSALIPHSYSDAVFYNLFDCITGEFNITRRTK